MAAALATLDSRDAAHAWLLLRQARALVADSRRVGAGRRLRRLAGLRQRRPPLRRRGARRRRASPAWSRPRASRRSASTASRASRALRGLKAAAGDIASRFLGAPSEQARRRRRHRHQRQDLDRVVDRAGAERARPALRRRSARSASASRRRDGRRRRARRRWLDRPDHARPGDAADRAAPTSSTRGFARLRDRGVVDRHRRASPRRHAGRRSRCSPTSPRTTSTTTATWSAYWQAKAQLFAWPGLRAAVVNLDDAQGRRARRLARRLARSTAGPSRRAASGAPARRERCATTATASPSTSSKATSGVADRDAADRRLQRRQPARRRSACCARSASPLADAAARVRGADAGAGPDAARRRRRCRRASPRSSSTTRTRPTRSRRRSPRCAPLATARGGKLWCVFGCGGNRDAAKRPLMGAIALPARRAASSSPATTRASSRPT